MPVLHQNICIFKGGLSSVSDGWANYKEKYLMFKIPIKMLKQHAIPTSGLQKVKVCSSKGYRKTSQRWITYVANTSIVKL